MTRPSAPTPPAYQGKSLGGILSSRREERGIPIEAAARATRIRARRLQDLENDDLSQFSHPSYARLFMQDYARYLEIPLADIRPFLPETGSYGGEGYDYLKEIPAEPAVWRMARRIQPRRRLVPALAIVVICLFAVLGGFQVWRTLRNLDRIGGETALKISQSGPLVAAVAEPQSALSAASAEAFPSQATRIESFMREDRDLLSVRGEPTLEKEPNRQVFSPQDL